MEARCTGGTCRPSIRPQRRTIVVASQAREVPEGEGLRPVASGPVLVCVQEERWEGAGDGAHGGGRPSDRALSWQLAEEGAHGALRFGKWRDKGSDFAGRRLRQGPERIYTDQEKYIVENVHPNRLEKGRAGQDRSPLSQHEFVQFRSPIHKLNWVARQSRPEAWARPPSSPKVCPRPEWRT